MIKGDALNKDFRQPYTTPSSLPSHAEMAAESHLGDIL